LQWPRETPIDGQPAEVVERVRAYDDWLAQSVDVPKLLLTFEPGPGIAPPAIAAWCSENVVNLEIVKCGRAGHQAPEDQPEAISDAILRWADHRNL
jgi:haloalkane dehalogenase